MQDPGELKKLIQRWSEELGFDGIGVTGVDISEDERYLNKWLKNKFHGSMNYMEKHGSKWFTIIGIIIVIIFIIIYLFLKFNG